MTTQTESPFDAYFQITQERAAISEAVRVRITENVKGLHRIEGPFLGQQQQLVAAMKEELKADMRSLLGTAIIRDLTQEMKKLSWSPAQHLNDDPNLWLIRLFPVAVQLESFNPYEDSVYNDNTYDNVDKVDLTIEIGDHSFCYDDYDDDDEEMWVRLTEETFDGIMDVVDVYESDILDALKSHPLEATVLMGLNDATSLSDILEPYLKEELAVLTMGAFAVYDLKPDLTRQF